MSLVRPLSLAVLAAGAGLVIAGIAWWALSYWQVWANSYLSLPQAGRCFIAGSPICRLAAALCTGQHRSFAASYSPCVVWLGAAALIGGGSLALAGGALSRAHEVFRPDQRPGDVTRGT